MQYGRCAQDGTRVSREPLERPWSPPASTLSKQPLGAAVIWLLAGISRPPACRASSKFGNLRPAACRCCSGQAMVSFGANQPEPVESNGSRLMQRGELEATEIASCQIDRGSVRN